MFFLIGCSKVSDEHQGQAATRAALKWWGETIIALAESGVDMRTCNSMDEVLSKWKGAFEIDFPFAERDYWERPYSWSLEVAGEDTLIVIASAGRNGVWEQRKGDDQSVEILIPKKGAPTMNLVPK
jgi:hypothetical protein